MSRWSFSAMWAYREFLGRAALFRRTVLATFVVASTLLLHQHLLADVAGGILLAAAGMGSFICSASQIDGHKNELAGGGQERMMARVGQPLLRRGALIGVR